MSATLQPPKSTSPFPSSPAGSNFIPRKEFVQQPPRQTTFALLAFSSNNVIRLSNFPQPFVTSLRTLLDSVIGLNVFRENSEHKLCEIVLLGKPWSNPKSLSTEIVVVQIFGVLFAHGYSFVSQLEYGREYNDRLSLTFSKPVSSSTPPDTLSTIQPKQPLLVPFALSFLSTTTLRVVCSPLHASPAILQSVRGAWPRGVTSEKKLGEGCFEFKLKGYSWFSEDTFPEDALAHILTILTDLDKHNWTLVTSIALTSARSRNKDLWIFSGPVADPSSSNESLPVGTGRTSPVNLGTPLSPSRHDAIMDHIQEGSGDSVGSGGSGDGDINKGKAQHARGATADSTTSLGRSGSRRLSKLPREHGRVTNSPSNEPPAVLRKKTPLKQVPDEGLQEQPQPQTELLPVDHDIIPGPPPPQVVYSTPAHGPPQPSVQHNQTETIHVSALPQQQFPSDGSSYDDVSKTPLGPPPSHPLISLPEAIDRHQADEDIRVAPAQHPINASSTTLQPPTNVFQGEESTPPLLGSPAFRTPEDEFRDSAFSDATYDVPIKWIPKQNGQQDLSHHPPPPSAFLAPHNTNADDRSSITSGPLLPGGWAPTPATEVEDPVVNMTTGTSATVMPERQNAAAPRSPEVVGPALPGDNEEADLARRKSEAGVLGHIPSPVQENAPPVPPVPPIQTNGHVSGEDKPKEGWVLVSVAGEPSASAPAPESVPTQEAEAAPNSQSADSPSLKSSGTTHVPLSAAQIIAAADAAPPPTPPSAEKEKGQEKEKERSSSALGRLFSRSRRKVSIGGIQKVKSVDQEVSEDVRPKKKSGGVLPTIRSGKRLSID